MSKFVVWRDCYVRSANNDCEWDGATVGDPCATLDEALAIAAAQTDWARYVIQDTPRVGMFPPFAGRPEDAAKRLAIQSETA